MKKAAIISIGSELMKGKMDDTNSTFISRWLHSLGIFTDYRINVKDSVDDIVEALGFTEKADIVILTGGLGPTDDDCTRDGVAKYLGKRLVINEEAWNDIRIFFDLKKLDIPISNKRQAMQIEGSEIIKNRAGTAPGIYYREDSRVFILVPGPPAENQLMIKNFILSKFKEDGFIEGEIVTEIFRIYNTGESAIADLFSPVGTECDIGYYFTQDGWVEIHVSYYSQDKEEAEEKVKITSESLKKLLKENEYFYTEDRDLSKIVFELFKEKGLKLAFAESITGGGLSGEFVKNAGVSDVFEGSIVAYSNDVKKNVLKVKNETLEKHGAVSEECVKEMSIGLKRIMGTEICVSISGIAGPTGGSNEKPVGLVYFGFMINDDVFCKKEIFLGSRVRIIRRCINFVFMELIKYFQGK